MKEYAIFESDDLGFIFQEIYECLMLSYASGCTEIRITVRSTTAISYINRWMPGWYRRAGPGGVWRDSQGNIKSVFIFGKHFLLNGGIVIDLNLR